MTRDARRAPALLLVGVVVALTAACGSSDAPRAGDGVQEDGETQKYVMVEGDVVFVDPTQPLPTNVRDDIAFTNQAVVDAAPVPDATVEGDPSRAVVITVAQQGAWAEAATGRQISLVYRIWGTPDVDGAPGTPQWLWAATRGASQAAIPDKAARVAEVTAFVAAQDDPQDWEIIVLT